MDSNVYTADFETRNNELNLKLGTSVWLADICNINSLEHRTFNNIDDFMFHLSKMDDSIIYFHNLKFDGNFIIYWLLDHNYLWVEDNQLNEHEFSTLITELGVFYNIKICFYKKAHRKKRVIEIRDSSKKIADSVKDIAISYKLPIKKGEIDYKLFRDEHYIATNDEIEYIHNDTEIIARVLKYFYDDGNDAMTSSSDSFKKYKLTVGEKVFNKLFPPPDHEQDTYIRQAYRGGVVLVNPKFKDKILHDVKIYDVNSMYPAQMYFKPLPYGKPIYFKGRYKRFIFYDLYIQHIFVCLDIKEGCMATILRKKALFGKKDYITSSNGELIELYLTNIEIDLMFKHYNVYEIKYIDGLMFKSSTNLFKKYIGPLYEIKCNSSGAIKQLAKMKLNSLSGKFAMNPKHSNKMPYIDAHDDILKYMTLPAFYDKPIYPAMSVFITAWAKKELFDAIDSNIESFVYCDTDSVHLLSEAKNIAIHDSDLGKWSLEKIYHTAKYLAQKTYFGIKGSKEPYSNDIKVAGCPSKVKEQMTLETFVWGQKFDGKLVAKKAKGGVVLVDVGFTLKERE